MSQRDDNADEVLDPAEMLQLMQIQQRSAAGDFSNFAWIICGSFGLAWILGFGSLWTAFGTAVPLSTTAAFIVLGTCLGIAAIVAVIMGIRSERGIRRSRAERLRGAVFGWSWPLTMVGASVFGQALQARGMSDEFTAYYHGCIYVILTGILLYLSGAVWLNRASIGIGVWLVVVGVVAPFWGLPAMYLFLTIAGGVGFFGFALASLVHNARLKRRAQHGASMTDAGGRRG